MRQRLREARNEAGYAAILVAILFPVVFLGCAATAVDTANWYLEMQKVQKAADAAALAGVPYLPQDLPDAIVRAKSVAKRNGYDDASADVTVSVSQGAVKQSQLQVTITSRIRNQFGSMIGVPHATISESAVADYTGPAPMGSPCNVFSNEPVSGAGAMSPAPRGNGSSALGSSHFSNCTQNPQFWADIEGPETGKVQGDRYQTLQCRANGVDGCDSSKTNTEYKKEGYVFLVHVEKAAVNQPIDLQLYDPAFVRSGQQCESLDASSTFVNNMNPYVTTDGTTRYSTASNNTNGSVPRFCTGDEHVDGGSDPMTTSFTLRQQTDSANPLIAPVQNATSGSPCTKQYDAYNSYPKASDLRQKKADGSDNGSYNDQLAKVFHNWVSLCTFTPARDGDYYLQVRTNVKFGGVKEANTNGKTPLISSGNAADYATDGDTTSGEGSNAFGIRAVTVAGLESSVAVSGWDHMPIYENGDSSTATFNLIRVLPGAAGKFVSFSFFDVADATNSGSVQVSLPADAKSTSGAPLSTPFPGGCTVQGGNNQITASSCKATVTSSANNGKVETISIPIPTDYTCNYASLGGCWYQVKVTFSSGSVHDVTTWDATVQGDPVRLVQ